MHTSLTNGDDAYTASADDEVVFAIDDNDIIRAVMRAMTLSLTTTVMMFSRAARVDRLNIVMKSGVTSSLARSSIKVMQLATLM